MLASILGVAVQAQNAHKYHVHIIATNGKVINKNYESAAELNKDEALRSFQAGRIIDEKSTFHPDQRSHKAFLVEVFDDAGNKIDSLFQAWDSEAAKQVVKSGNSVPAPKEPPAPPQVEDRTIEAAAGTTDIGKAFLQKLKKDKILAHGRNASFKITSSYLVINDRKQPEEVFLKYRNFLESIKG
jgi:hypothetical protein